MIFIVILLKGYLHHCKQPLDKGYSVQFKAQCTLGVCFNLAKFMNKLILFENIQPWIFQLYHTYSFKI